MEPPSDHHSSPEVLLVELGTRLARQRLARNLTQAVLAAEAGVSTITVRRLEAGRSIQVANLIRVLRALGLVDNLEALVPEPPAQPLQELERHGRRRRRASSPTRRTEERPRGGWTWGEDAGKGP